MHEKRIESLSQKISLREQTLLDYRVIRERSVRKTQRNVTIMASSAKVRNEQLLDDIAVLLKESTRARQSFAKIRYVANTIES